MKRLSTRWDVARYVLTCCWDVVGLFHLHCSPRAVRGLRTSPRTRVCMLLHFNVRFCFLFAAWYAREAGQDRCVIFDDGEYC